MVLKKVFFKGKMFDNSAFTFNTYDDVFPTELNRFELGFDGFESFVLTVSDAFGCKSYKRFKISAQDKQELKEELEAQVERNRAYTNAINADEEDKQQGTSNINEALKRLKALEKVATF